MNDAKTSQEWISLFEPMLEYLSCVRFLEPARTDGIKTKQERFDCLLKVAYSVLGEISKGDIDEIYFDQGKTYSFNRRMLKRELKISVRVVKDYIWEMNRFLPAKHKVKGVCRKFKPHEEPHAPFNLEDIVKRLESIRNPIDPYDIASITKSNYERFAISNPTDFYVYALYDFVNHKVFYIGKGKGQRMFSHRNPANRTNRLTAAYINSIDGNYVELVLSQGLSESDALSMEADLIYENYKDLTNISNPKGSVRLNKFISLGHFKAYAKKVNGSKVTLHHA